MKPNGGTAGAQPRRRRKWLLVVAIISITLISLLYSYQNTEDYNQEEKGNIIRVDGNSSGAELIVDQPNCKIPRTDIWPKFLKDGAWHVNHKPDCRHEKLLAVLEENDGENETLRLLQTDGENRDDEDCCVNEIKRLDPHGDEGYRLSICEPLRRSTPMDVHGKQMLLIKCGDRLNFEATIPTDISAVKNKYKYWKDLKKHTSTSTEIKALPISVLLLGIDSVSRSHAHRSLPRTLDYMTSSMGFIDFQGYHTARPFTLPNFMGFLMGTPEDEVRRTCAPDWSSTWDKCPLIWKEFDEAHYVTMYIEDGSQTFNWGGQAGFNKEPTDFYIHTLFSSWYPLHGSAFRRWWDGVDEKDGYCVSNETIPQFVIRYTRRFVDKFSPKTNLKIADNPPPFFSFTWFENPFHDDMYTVPTLDEELLHLMQHLNSESKHAFLESTLIVFLSDHGDRFSFLQSASIESFIERSLPPLFVRVPDSLRRRFPEYAEALKWNAANGLVSPFDLHHTMLHLLQLDSEEFTPVLADRSSLFHRVEGSRTCKQLHLDPEFCICNMALDPESLSDPFILKKLMPFVEEKLNQLVAESGYEEMCATWVTGMEFILSAKILQRESNWNWRKLFYTSFDVLLKFKAHPLDAYFEVRVRIWVSRLWSEWTSTELLSDFIRINLYGQQSVCIKGKTVRDKRMKELCVCKDQVPAGP